MKIQVFLGFSVEPCGALWTCGALWSPVEPCGPAAAWSFELLEGAKTTEAIITTEKDVERIRPLTEAADLPILVLKLHIHWWDVDALDALLSSIRGQVEGSRSNPDI